MTAPDQIPRGRPWRIEWKVSYWRQRRDTPTSEVFGTLNQARQKARQIARYRDKGPGGPVTRIAIYERVVTAWSVAEQHDPGPSTEPDPIEESSSQELTTMPVQPLNLEPPPWDRSTPQRAQDWRAESVTLYPDAEPDAEPEVEVEEPEVEDDQEEPEVEPEAEPEQELEVGPDPEPDPEPAAVATPNLDKVRAEHAAARGRDVLPEQGIPAPVFEYIPARKAKP